MLTGGKGEIEDIEKIFSEQVYQSNFDAFTAEVNEFYSNNSKSVEDSKIFLDIIVTTDNAFLLVKVHFIFYLNACNLRHFLTIFMF